MVFDLVLTPYRSPYQEQADAYMKARYMMFSEIVDTRKKSSGAIHTSDQEVAEHDHRPVYECEDDVDEEMMTSTHISIGTELHPAHETKLTKPEGSVPHELSKVTSITDKH